MADAGIGNPLGFEPVMDAGNPRTIGGIAGAHISGGTFVYASGVNATVGSQSESFANTDIIFQPSASGAQVTGVALQTAGSNTEVSVVTRGIIIGVANGTVNAGFAVKVDGNNAVAELGSTSVSIKHGASDKIGRAVTGAGSNGFLLIDIQG